MKRVVFTLLAASSTLIFSPVILADTKPAFETITTTAGAAEPKKAGYATDIVVTNFGSHVISMQLPGYNFSSFVYPNGAQHFHSYDSAYKRVILADYNGRIFYDAITPNVYPIDVYDALSGTVAKARSMAHS